MDAGIESRAELNCGGSRVGCDTKSERGGETDAHARLKRLALLWAQARGYSACALEVALPRCRYRADVAAYKPDRLGESSVSSVEAAVPGGAPKIAAETAATTGGKRSEVIGSTAVFECKQALVDLRRDNGSSAATRERLEKVHVRRQILEKNLRIHYPQMRIADSLFSEFDSHDFEKIKHRGYARVSRELAALQNRLFDCAKFERLVRYRCANLFFLVLPAELFREPEIPIGWGALVESNGALDLVHKPVWHEVKIDNRIRLLQRIAAAGTRALNRQLEITFDDVLAARARL